MRDLELSSIERRDVTLHYIREKTMGWMYLVLDDKSGLVAIHSDWGSASFCWTARGDQSIAEFFCSADSHYLLTKFSYDNPAHKEKEIDVAATRKTLYSWWPEIDHRDDIEAFLEDAQDTNTDIALARMGLDLDIFSVAEAIVYKPTGSVAYWLEQVIPAIQRYLRAEVLS